MKNGSWALVGYFEEIQLTQCTFPEERETLTRNRGAACPTSIPQKSSKARECGSGTRDWLPPGPRDAPGYGKPFLGFGGPGPLGQAIRCCSRSCKFNGNRTNIEEKKPMRPELAWG